jgi:hypothetical protein
MIGEKTFNGSEDQLATAYHYWKSIVDTCVEEQCPPKMEETAKIEKTKKIEHMVTELMTKLTIEKNFGVPFGTLSLITGRTISIGTLEQPPPGHIQYKFSFDKEGNVSFVNDFFGALKDPEAETEEKIEFTQKGFVTLEGTETSWVDETQMKHR